YRHAAPSGPWPWVDFNKDFSAPEPSSQINEGAYEWSGYPQKLFGNWTFTPVARSKMLLTECPRTEPCRIYGIDVTNDGTFNAHKPGLNCIEVENVRVRALFVDNLAESVLKMLGTKYNIEPFFFSSSANWIPSRYREEVQHKKGDHITVILPFIGTTEKKNNTPSNSSGPSSSFVQHFTIFYHDINRTEHVQRRNTIDVMAPLHLHAFSIGEHVLFIDLLAIHMIRRKDASTIITYHPTRGGHTTAERLHQVMERAGGSVYWNKIFQESKDPTFFFLQILWYALYSWDEAFEVLYTRIKELAILNNVDFASMADRNHSLHSLQAHLLQYQTHLHDFEKSVTFVKENPNPALEPDVEDDATKDSMKREKELMERECDNLLSEITRLEKKCTMFVNRLKNATELAFAAVNIELTKATLRDSAAMKQISYLTMVFLPASFTASVFGMNVVEINPGSLETIARYVETTIALTLFTTWIVIALQPYSSIHEHSGGGVWRRMAWPFYFSNTLTEYLRQVKPPSSQKDNTPSSQKDITPSSQKDITPSSQKDNTSMRFLPRRGPSFLNKREGSLA
ncbi:hypothetical protein P692DRAFT_201712546, partial [Suillus brevipes Sb2]